MPLPAKWVAERRQMIAEMNQRNAEARQAREAWAKATGQPSEASQGNGSDFGQDEDFFGDMESFRRENMGTGFEGTPEENKRRTPGDLGLPQGALSDGNARAAAGAFIQGNNDPNDRRPDVRGNGVAVADDISHPGNVLNHDNAAGRRGIDSLNDEQQSETAPWWRQGGGHGVTDADGVPPGGAAHSWAGHHATCWAMPRWYDSGSRCWLCDGNVQCSSTSGTFHVIAQWSTAFNPVIIKQATSVITVP